MNRIRKLQSFIKFPILIKKKANLHYLTGRSFDYRAEEYLLVTKQGVVGFGSGLEQIDWVNKSDRLKNIGKYIKAKKLDIEWGFTYGEGEYLNFKLKGLGLKIKVEPKLCPADEMRQVKESSELLKIQKSMRIVAKVFGLVTKQLRSRSWTERGLADFITKSGFKLGAEDIAFPAIVASGANAAVPHHIPSLKRLKFGESIIIDFGFKYKHYCSDFTRTVFLKSVPKRLEKAYNQVEKAYNESIKYIDLSLRVHSKQSKQKNRLLRSVRNDKGVTGNDIYQKAVDVLAQAKLDQYFVHSLGHGTGLEIHELPNLSPGSKDKLKDNMVFSIEPGVYLKNLGGIRIEDLVYLRKGKVNKFINIPTTLKEMVL